MPELPEVEAWARELDPLVRAFPIEHAGPAHVAQIAGEQIERKWRAPAQDGGAERFVEAAILDARDHVVQRRP